MWSSPYPRPSDRRRTASRVLAVIAAAATVLASCGEASQSESPAGTVAVTPGSTATNGVMPSASAAVAASTDDGGSGAYAYDAVALEASSLPINLEMRNGCGLCGEAWWLFDQPRFRLYADGRVLFADGIGEDRRYRSADLTGGQVEELIRFAMDEGGLADAKARYDGNIDDAGETVIEIHAEYIDEAAGKRVILFPADGDLGATAIRERLGVLERTLAEFETWLSARGMRSEPFEPLGYAAALMEEWEGAASVEWPLAEVPPDAFAPGAWAQRLARLTPGQAKPVLGDRMVTIVQGVPSAPGRAAALVVRPLLPGDDVPGAFGLRPDTVAVAVTDGIRVRSLPEVSDASVKLEPLLREGDVLYVVDGPVAGSGYQWIQVYAARPELEGWVAIESKEGESWVEPRPLRCTLGASDDPLLGQLPYALMHLACYGDVATGGTYRLTRTPGDESCTDEEPYKLEPAWLNRSTACDVHIGVDNPDTGGFDLPATGVFHPEAAAAARDLLDAASDPAVGIMVTVTGRLDHPGARACHDVEGPASSEVWVQLVCRAAFVITGVEPSR